MKLVTALFLLCLSAHAETFVQLADGVIPVPPDLKVVADQLVAGYVAANNRLPTYSELLNDFVAQTNAVTNQVAAAAAAATPVPDLGAAQLTAGQAYATRFGVLADPDTLGTLTAIQATGGQAGLNQELDRMDAFAKQAQAAGIPLPGTR